MRPALILPAWALFIAACGLWGTYLNASGVDLRLNAPPLFGKWDLRLGASVLVPIAVAGAVVWAAPVACRRAPWRLLLGLVALAALAWGVGLALIDSITELERPLRVKTQYIHAVAEVGSPGAFLSSFVDRIDTFPTHVRAHPPAMVLGLWALAQIGLGGTWPAAMVILLAAASTGPAVLIATRAVAGEDVARRAAPFLVLGAAALSITTTADGLYMAIGAWGICLLVLALTFQGGRPLGTDVLAVGGGLLLGIALFCSYGLVLLGTVPLAVAIARRRVRPLVLATLAVLGVVAAFGAAGFWWWDGFLATHREYRESVAMTRPYGFFLFANLAALAVWLGPAVVVALAKLRDDRLWLLVGGGIAAVLLANVSGLSKAEIERIWLPFLPWILVAGAALGPSRPWLASQAAVGLLVGISVNSTL